MMIDAASTWGLVIGIDTYDSEDVPDLKGAARDAAASVAWLRSLGVPDAQILLHAAPSAASKAELDALGIDVHGCREPEIWASFEKLMAKSGSKLFVFLSGHGLWEPGGERVFLTREATVAVMKNLGITWYARFLRGLPFAQQFIVMDGCLNAPYSSAQRASFRAGEQAAVVPAPEIATTSQWFCYGASINERALEDDDRGMFSKSLLTVLNPDRRDARCVVIDDSTGTTALDLTAAITNVVAPEVSAKARTLGRPQNPGMQMLSGGQAPASVRVAEFAADRTVSISVHIEPSEALSDISRVTLFSDDVDWRRFVPTPPDPAVPETFQSVLPPGLRMQVRCALTPGTTWMQPAQQEFLTDQDREIRFRFEKPEDMAAGVAAGEPMIVSEINTVGVGGEIVGAMSSEGYERVQQILDRDGAGIRLETHETGPRLYSLRKDAFQLRDVTLQITSALNSVLPEDLVVRARGVDTSELTTTVTIPVSAEEAQRLGGLLQHTPVVFVGEADPRSLADLVTDPVVPVEPGPVTVRLALPWGTWTTRVIAAENATVEVKLPPEVGIPPLRVELARDPHPADAGPGHSVVLLGGRAIPQLETIDGTKARLVATDAGPWWGGRWFAPAIAPSPDWTTIGQIARKGRRLRFPLNPWSAIAVSPGDHPRAEPLSTYAAGNWDRLVAAGRLEDVTSDDAVSLTQAKGFDQLLGLAGAYGCFAQQLDDYVPIVLGNLAIIDDGMPDVALLAAALDSRLGRRTDETRARLESLAVTATGGVPLFSWGIAIGAIGARHYGVSALADRYEAISENLIGESTWTLWEED